MKVYYSKKSRKSTVIRLVAIQLLVSFGFYFISGDLTNVSIGLWIVWILILLFVLLGILKAIQNKPTLLIEKDGIMESSTLQSCGKISWDNIKNVAIKKGVNMTFLCVDLIEEKLILDAVNPVVRLLMRSNKKKLGTICAIPEISLDDNLDSVLNEMKNYMEKYKRQHTTSGHKTLRG
ncbi:STM3941 family protein [Labilibaculum euxinus]